MDYFDGLCLKEHIKGNGWPRYQIEMNNSPDLGYADVLSILDESVSKMNEFLEVLRIRGARIGLKNNVRKTKSLRLWISDDEKVTLGNEKIDQVGSFTYLGSIISKDGGCSENIKSRIAMAQSAFSQLKKKFGRISRLEYWVLMN